MEWVIPLRSLTDADGRWPFHIVFAALGIGMPLPHGHR